MFNLSSLLGYDQKSLAENPEKANKAFLAIVGHIKPMMDKRGIKSIVIYEKPNGELDFDMLDYNIKNREAEMLSLISELNNKLLKK